MSKEVSRLLEKGSVEFGALWLQLQFGENRLKPQGRKRFREIKSLIKANQKIMISEWINVLDGFDYTSSVYGLDRLESLPAKNLLLIGNHSNEGPLRGHGHILITSYYVKKLIGQEIRWVHGQDKTTIQELSRKPLERMLNTIPVREKDAAKGVRLILKAFANQETVGIYPEGDGNKSLIKASPTAGRLIFKASELDISIVCVATQFENNTFFANFSILDKQTILNYASKQENRNTIGQSIVDHAMGEVAKYLPPSRRGYYSYITI